MGELGSDFVHNRHQSKHKAFAAMRDKLMLNLPTICPNYFAPKDVISTVMDIENFLRDNPESDGRNRTPAELVSDFLNGSENDDLQVV